RRRHTRSKRDWSSDVCSSDLNLGKFVLSSLQPGARGRAQIRRYIYVRANRWDKTAAKIVGAEDLFLPAMLSFLGDGTSTGRRPQIGRASCRERVVVSVVSGGV